MSALPTSILGRTGLDVTKLGYGAMELRGPDDGRARVVPPAEADVCCPFAPRATGNIVPGRSRRSSC
jgi:hypothetical protein